MTDAASCVHSASKSMEPCTTPSIICSGPIPRALAHDVHVAAAPRDAIDFSIRSTL
ncbi:MAG: hypothetical protein DIJKHBIC_03035 [Thermoanaerobaculia bacterium]|nr:hypothetical protein [Thermoanaerobaculia bacterium]